MTGQAMSGMSEQRLLRAAYHHLARYATNRHGLSRVLERKLRRAADGAAPDADARACIDRVCARCAELGLLDEQAYAQGRAETLMRRGAGTRRIAQDLAARGVPEAVVQTVLANLAHAAADAGGPDWQAAIALARRKRLGPFAAVPLDPEDAAAWRRALGVFARAGIGYEIAQAVLRASDPDALEVVREDGMD
ncbi:MAG: regulatory protein RecX [Rhodothalassiaceae bacterium]